jgi:hypothetical protein
MGCDGWAWLWEALCAVGRAFRASVAGRGPSRLRINKPPPLQWIGVIGSELLDQGYWVGVIGLALFSRDFW